MTDVEGGVVSKNFVGPKWKFMPPSSKFRLLVGTPHAWRVTTSVTQSTSY